MISQLRTHELAARSHANANAQQLQQQQQERQQHHDHDQLHSHSRAGGGRRASTPGDGHARGSPSPSLTRALSAPGGHAYGHVHGSPLPTVYEASDRTSLPIGGRESFPAATAMPQTTSAQILREANDRLVREREEAANVRTEYLANKLAVELTQELTDELKMISGTGEPQVASSRSGTL